MFCGDIPHRIPGDIGLDLEFMTLCFFDLPIIHNGQLVFRCIEKECESHISFGYFNNESDTAAIDPDYRVN